MCYTQYTGGKVIGAELFPVVPGLVLPQEGLRSEEPPPYTPPPLLAPVYSTPHISFNFQPLLSVSPGGERTLLDLSSTGRKREKKPVGILGLV
jgi:hypothetical protein